MKSGNIFCKVNTKKFTVKMKLMRVASLLIENIFVKI